MITAQPHTYAIVSFDDKVTEEPLYFLFRIHAWDGTHPMIVDPEGMELIRLSSWIEERTGPFWADPRIEELAAFHDDASATEMFNSYRMPE